jgi:SAM-dependent methyltransferase
MPTGDGADAVDWEARYRDGRAGWERGGLHPALIEWRLEGVLAPCRILVPGAGRSPEPRVLADDGFDVTVVDNAPTAIAHQRHALSAEPGVEVIDADLFAWEPEAPFQVIYDQTCLCALPPELRAEYVARLHRWLVPGGRLFMLFMQTGRAGGPPYDCPIPTMRALFAHAAGGAPGWDWPGALPDPVAHPLGFFEQPALLHRMP